MPKSPKTSRDSISWAAGEKSSCWVIIVGKLLSLSIYGSSERLHKKLKQQNWHLFPLFAPQKVHTLLKTNPDTIHHSPHDQINISPWQKPSSRKRNHFHHLLHSVLTVNNSEHYFFYSFFFLLLERKNSHVLQITTLHLLSAINTEQCCISYLTAISL